MPDGFEELTRIIQKTGRDGKLDRQIYVNRTEMSAEELVRAARERDALFRSMEMGGLPLLNGMEKLFGDIDPELKEAIDRARRVGRFR